MHNTLSKWGKIELGKQDSKKSGNHDQLALFQDDTEDTSLPLTPDTLYLLWHQSFIVEGYESKDDADFARRKGEKILKLYFDWWGQSERSVLAIEKGFSIDIDMNTIKGRFDRVERIDGNIVVIDYKTSGVRPQEEVDTDLQLSIYALACEQVFGEPCTDLLLLFLREDGITEVKTQRSLQQLAGAQEIINSLTEGIDEGMFEATPSPSVCKRCPYRGVCNAADV